MSELRKRKSAPPTDGDDSRPKSPAGSKGKALADVMKTLGPMWTNFIKFLDIITPIIARIVSVTMLFLDVCPTEILSALFGLALCFFGGTFVVTIAAIEAFRHSGWETTKGAIKVLYDEWEVFRLNSREDDEKDEDGDGIPDVKQVDATALASRKFKLFLVNCKDPNQVNIAISGIWTSTLAVLATLKIQFAQVIALGVSIGSMLRGPAKSFVGPALQRVMPQDYHKWIPSVLDWTCKAIAVSIAWFIQRVISAVQSGIRGGLMFSRNLMKYANKRGIISFTDEDSQIDEIVGWTLAAVGIWFQLSHFFALPFPWNIILIPLRVLEYILMW
eukprot:CAMPEP_0117745950 /NCGR_PEP_ID=MMETSP0947-20121206/7667_1 /TAXON_ID=44440 /ORGANISM="Chattonella subsalsa, Strain CCMP2191" /LENGTH=330 /DNA_ID=CAMNT_0005563203 /DNA_START=83 /DNA_END=1072 /DNA_ORIENTATION=-